jgi:hypothetical protein
MVVMSEIDGGDADAFAESILNSVQDGLNKGIEAAATAIGVAITGPLGPIVGALLGGALKLAVDKLFDEINNFGDDVMFPPAVFSYKYDSLANWVPSVGYDAESRRTVLTDDKVSTSAGGGKYTIWHQWRRGDPPQEG